MKNPQMTTEAVELLKKLIATPSISRDETAAADVLEAYMKEKGLNPQRHGNNTWCVSPDFDESKPVILLNAHIDTVKPVAGWQHDPFTPVIEGDKLYGLGSNDCGGGLMALLQVFMLLINEKKAYNLIYLPKIDFAIVGEPTGMQPAIAEKGLMVIDAVAHGKAGHAARNEGDNAIYHAMKDIQWLSEWQFPKQTELLGPVKQTVTIINAGTQHNVIPDECTFTIDVRSNECYTNEEIFAFFQEHLTSELKARSFRLSSSSIPMEHPFVQACVKEGLTPFGSPTLSDQALMRFPSLKLGPGESSRSHTADEYIKISEIDDAISLYVKLLSSL